jgi:hypothetical protein
MKRVSWMIALLAACGGSSKPAPAPVENKPVVEAPARAKTRQVQALDDLAQIKVQACACTDARCANDVQATFETWAKDNEDTHGTQAQAEKAGKLAGDISECIVRATGDEQPDALTAYAASQMPLTGIVECDAYAQAMQAYIRCDKVPQSARDAARQGLDAMEAGWANASGMPDDAKKAANDACKQATDALKQGAQAMGCSI